MALLAGISEENGLESYLIQRGSIKTEDFMEFIRRLKTDNP